MYNKVLNFVFYIIMSFGLLAGLLSIYRGTLRKASMKIVSGKVINKIRDYTSGGKGRHYYTAFELEGLHDEIAINFPSENAADNDSTFYLIDTGKLYTFYLNPTYPIKKGINMGLERIDYKNIEIYKTSNTFNLFMGIFICLLCLISITLKMKYKKKENEI